MKRPRSLTALHLDRPADASRLVLAQDELTLATDLTKSGKRLAFLPADEVRPEVRALAWGNASPVRGRPRRAIEGLAVDGSASEIGAARPTTRRRPGRSFAGGDIMLDRGVCQTLEIKGKGADFPFDGGTADITARVCCSGLGWNVPQTKRTGNAGAVRNLISSADIAIANFENPAPDDPSYHTKGPSSQPTRSSSTA